jgi:hypothetical protein
LKKKKFLIRKEKTLTISILSFDLNKSIIVSINGLDVAI